MNKNIFIGDREISNTSPVFIIAELSCNHNGKLDLALKTIDAMHEAGADCVKLQTSKPDSITIDCSAESFIIKGGTLWDGKTLFELYQQVYTPWEWHEEIKNYVESKGMVFFSSPFDLKAVDFLEELGVPAYKIASFEITDIPLIEYTAKKGKPIIISTGIATEQDIELAIQTCKNVGNEDVIILKCTSAYPTPLEEVNLKVIPDIRKRFNCLVGLSDHTMGTIVPLGAVSLGAKVIEKHFILDRSLGGPDAAFSMEPAEFKEMVDTVRMMEKALGKVTYELSEKVMKNKQFARSLFITEDVKENTIITAENVKSIRPGNGLHPKYYNEILGKTFNQQLLRGTPLTIEMINKE
ncbi:pseudaminic acid synthase [Bizionia myxarmorum]|uniref:Pseudaminic acid synthase n=1 Tax=Bizionia myxarmorum TaxID=291186 RepID=A0A5D0RCI5_9FLAO|nr:pseudaminic acid synthase [Bizionia myxarmorum]TYB78759.1 pseudaminic acid synthase [Bizionia myxarmorum]